MRRPSALLPPATRPQSIIVGRDPEVACPRPPDLKGFYFSFFPYNNIKRFFIGLWNHARRRLTAYDREAIPESELPSIQRTARIYIAIYGGVVILTDATQSLLPLFFVGLPNLFGSWLMQIYGFTQHAGLAENVLDHRLNCRTRMRNPLRRGGLPSAMSPRLEPRMSSDSIMPARPT